MSLEHETWTTTWIWDGFFVGINDFHLIGWNLHQCLGGQLCQAERGKKKEIRDAGHPQVLGTSRIRIPPSVATFFEDFLWSKD